MAVRVERHCENALKVAKFLEEHQQVNLVKYPFLKSHRSYEIAKKQMPKFGAMLTFDVGDGNRALKVLDNLELCCFSASLGGVRTTTQIPALMAFLDIPEEERLEMGISNGMIRVSVGIEDVDDIIVDFDNALALM